MTKEWMTPKRRYLSGLFGGRVDRIPVGSPTNVATIECMKKTNVFFPEAHIEPGKMAALAATAHDILGYDAIMPYFSVQLEAPIFGCKMDWGTPEVMPDCITHPYKEPEDIVIPSEKEIKEIYSIKALLECIKLLSNKYPQVAIMGKVMGPWTLAYHAFGIENFLMMSIDHPDKVTKILNKLKKITILHANLQIQAGADVMCVPDHATGDLVSPKMYKQFLPSIHQEITKQIGVPTILHICGNTLDRADAIVEEGFDCFHYDTKTDLVELKKITGKKISLAGGINNAHTLVFGSPDDVKREALFAAKEGVEILAPECATPMQTPNNNLKAILEVAKKIDINELRGA